MNTTLEIFNSKIKERKKRNRSAFENEKRKQNERGEEQKTLFKKLMYYLKPFDGQTLEGNKIKLEINNRNCTIKFFINKKEYVQFASCVRPYICDCQDYCDCEPRDIHEMYYFGENVRNTNINFSDGESFTNSIINLMDDYREDN